MNQEDYDVIKFLEYLKYRASYDEAPLALEEGFILESFHVGVRFFFGVTVDDKGQPMHDTQQPCEGFLEEWLDRSLN